MFSKKDYYLAQKLVHTVLDAQDFAIDNFKELYLKHFDDFDEYIGYDEKTMGQYLWNMRTFVFAVYFTFYVKVGKKSLRDIYVNNLLLKGKQKQAAWVASALKEFRTGVFKFEKQVSSMRSVISTTEGPKETFEFTHLPRAFDIKDTKYLFPPMVKIDGRWWSVTRGVSHGNMESDALRYYLLSSELHKDKHPWIIGKLHMEDMQGYLDKQVSVMFKGV